MKQHPYLFLTKFIVLALVLTACDLLPRLSAPTPSLLQATAEPLPSPTPTAQAGRASSSFNGGAFATPTPLAAATAVVPGAATERLNEWFTVMVPAGWEQAAGPHGLLVARDLNRLPQTALMLVRRWQGIVTLEDWRAHLPDGVAERNSNATIGVGGRDWQGLFITREGAYRAFFAVSQDGQRSYSLLVYVPVTAGLSAGESFDREAPVFNQMLRTAQHHG